MNVLLLSSTATARLSVTGSPLAPGLTVERNFGGLLDARARQAVASAANEPAPSAVAFDQGSLFGHATATMEVSKVNVYSGLTTPSERSIPSSPSIPLVPLASKPAGSPKQSAQTPDHASGPDEPEVPPEVTEPSLTGESQSFSNRLAPMSFQAPVCSADLPLVALRSLEVTSPASRALPSLSPTRSIETVSLKSEVPLANPALSEARETSVTEFGLIYLAVHADGDAVRIGARVSGLDSDGEDRLEQSMQTLARDASVDVAAVRLNGRDRMSAVRG